MTARDFALVVAFVALATLPYWMTGVYYVNVASQILFYAVFALGLNVLVGYGGLGIARPRRPFRRHRLRDRLHVAARLWPSGCDFRRPRRRRRAMAMYAALSLRSTGIGFIMITLALGEILWGLAYRWISLTGGDNGMSVQTPSRAIRLFAVGCECILLRHAVVFLLSLVAMAIFVRSPLGAALMGTRDQPRRMNALGYHVWGSVSTPACSRAC